MSIELREPEPGLSRLINSGDALPRPLQVPGSSGGALMRVLREEAGAGIKTATVELPPGWSSPGLHSHSVSEELFVLSGSLTVGNVVMSRNWYAYRPAGLAHGPCSSTSGALILAIWGGTPDFLPATAAGASHPDAVGPLDVDQMAWVNRPGAPGPNGSSFGRKILRVDPVTGADTRYLVVGPGFEGWGPNFHPVHEEIFCLEGDIGPDDRLLLSPGSYLHNPAFGIHGEHEHSIGGATVLEWHSGKWEIVFMDAEAPGGRERPAAMGRVYDGER